MGRLVILSGPSCVGKGPLHAALRRLYPELAGAMRTVVLYNSRSPRPGERDGVDYHFRRREEIEALRGREGFVVMEVRGDLQAADLGAIERDLADGDVLFEGNPFFARVLLDCPLPPGARRLSVFLSPLSLDEIVYLSAPERHVLLADFVTDVMRRKLLRRTRREKTNLSLRDLEDIERRAASAIVELKEAWRFDRVIPNHDGEDSENWDAFYYPVGDARRVLLAFVDLLSERAPDRAETWPEHLIA
jgi:guanylate kinase